MILPFKKHFVTPIRKGIKIHTIRWDEKGRWKKGNKIHYATGVRTKKYKQFKSGECISTQKIEIKWADPQNHDEIILKGGVLFKILIDGRDVSKDAILLDTLAKNDGFENFYDFMQWESWNWKDFTGKIIHWTNLKY